MTEDQVRLVESVKDCIVRKIDVGDERGLIPIIDELRAQVARLTEGNEKLRSALDVARNTMALLGDTTALDLLRAEVARLTRELADANYWRERWANEQKAAAEQSQKNWAEAKRLREERDEAREMAKHLAMCEAEDEDREAIARWDAEAKP